MVVNWGYLTQESSVHNSTPRSRRSMSCSFDGTGDAKRMDDEVGESL